MAEYKYIGKSIPRIDAKEKVTGKALFTCDYMLPRMLTGKVLRSPYPHARIISIDTSKAEKVSGVRAVITAKDTPPVRWSVSVEDEYVLPTDNIVRKVDDPVAAVAAETPEAAEEAIELIEVEYEELPHVTTWDEARSKNPPAVLHPDIDSYSIYPPMSVSWKWVRDKSIPNELQRFGTKTGDVEKGFAEADLIVENTYETARAHHCQPETHGYIAQIDDDGRVTIISSTQTHWLDRTALSRIYRCDEEEFKFINPWLGCGWGGKFGLKEEPIAIELSRKTGRPVRILTSRRECFTMTECRLGLRSHIKDGFKKDGTLVAREILMELSCGAYSSLGGLIVKNATFGAVGSYKTQNFKLNSIGYYMNLPKASVLRGVGTPEIIWGIEQQMDIAAEKLGIGLVDIRTKNILRHGDIDVEGQEMKTTGAEACVKTVAEMIKLDEKITQQAGPWKRGRGIALGNKYTCAGQGSAVDIKVLREGIVEVRHNAIAMGQGTHTCLAQMAAECFQIPMEKIRVFRGDTATMPYDAGSWSSRSIFHTGNALIKACDDAKQKMFVIASPKLGIPADELETSEGRIYRKSLPSRWIPFADLFVPGLPIALNGSEIVGKSSYISPIILEDECGHSERMCAYYSFTAYGVEVLVNEETGQVKIVRAVAATDNGQPINPKLTEIQVQSGFAMGVGAALYEEMKFDNGIPLNPSFMDYKVPTVMEVPTCDDIEVVMRCDPFDEGPFGAKGMGENVYSAPAPAIANAIYDAVGVRVNFEPITRERLLQALKRKK